MLNKFFMELNKLYTIWVESILFKNWFNPLMTIYVNFRSLPLRQAFKLPVFIYGWPQILSLYGKMECHGTCKTGMIKINRTIDGAPSNPGPNTAINNWGTIVFHGACLIHTANKINVAKGATLDLGTNTKIMHYCNITAHNQIVIGSNTRITHRCQILDSNFHFIVDFNKQIIRRYSKPIYIGKSCWICNTSSVTAGAKIPNCTIVASNSLVNKDFSNIPEESIIGGIPAKYIASGYRRVNNPKLEIEVWKYFLDHPDINEYHIAENFDHSNCD